MKNMMYIPSQFGYAVDVDGFLPIITHPQFQKLNGKRQTGILYKTYPGVTHTRFEHSIGTFQIAQAITQHLDIPDIDARAVQAYALLHDICHAPYSHNLEYVLENGHNGRAIAMVESMRETIEKSDVDCDRVLSLMKKQHPLYEVVKHKVLGADKLDWMFRDAHHVGRSDGPDAKNIIQHLIYDGNQIKVHADGAAEVAKMQHHYSDMHTFLYYSQQYLSNQRMLQRAVQGAMHADEIDEDTLVDMTDAELDGVLARSSCPETRHLSNHLHQDPTRYQPIVSIRIQPFNRQEQHAVGVSKDTCMRFLDTYKSGAALSRLESALGDDVLVTTIVDLERLTDPHDVRLHTGLTLFEYMPQLAQSLEEAAYACFSIRAISPKDQGIDEIQEKLLDALRT
ncbi:MAG: HD domain-containing protein [Nanoarchaeota archaeon]